MRAREAGASRGGGPGRETRPEQEAAAEPKPDGTARAPWFLFGIVSIALFMSSLDGTIVATGLPTLRHALHAGLNWTGWTMTGYQLGLVVAMPIAGRIADNFGRKRVFLTAAVLFTTSSLLCGLSVNIGMLICLRALQAAGGAAFLPSASGIVKDTFKQHSQRALGLFSSIFPLGALVGPVVGGIILSTWSWRGLFLVNVPVGTAFTLLAWRYLPSSERRDGRADLVGAVLLGGGVMGMMLAITDLGNKSTGFLSPACAIPLVLAIACGWGFLRHCANVPQPLIPLHLLRGRAFAATNLLNFVWGGAVIGFGALVPLLAEDRYGLSPLASGTLLTARAIAEIVLAIFASMVIHRTGYRLPIIGGIALITAGLVMAAAPAQVVSPYLWLAVGATLTGLGIGMSAPAANNASIELAPDDIGAITGLRGAARQGGAIVSITIVTAIADHSGREVHTIIGAFVVVAVLLAAVVPLVFLVPDGKRRAAAIGSRSPQPRMA